MPSPVLLFRHALRPPGLRALSVAFAGLAAWIVVLLVLPTLSLAAAAAPKGEDTPLGFDAGDAGAAHTGSSGGGIARVIGGLFIVIAVIYGVTWILKQTRRAKQQSVGVGMELVTSMPLGGGGALQLVRVGDEVLLVGSGANGATVLRRYDEDEARALELWPDPEPLDAADRPVTPLSPLARVLASVVDRLRDLTVRR